jgi:hypothetical protein
LPEPYRAAVYYAPERDDPLWGLGCAWLGRDAEMDEARPQPGVLAHLTVSPRRYGFHATLKPPMRLKLGFDAFLDGAKKLSAGLKPFRMPALEVRQLGRFTALCLAEHSAAFRALADDCVTALDAHRLPEDAAAQAARAVGRSARQRVNIERFGYPLLFEDWQFHMTLSDAVGDPSLREQADLYFEAVLAAPRRVTSICIFQEVSRGGDFLLTHRLRLGA